MNAGITVSNSVFDVNNNLGLSNTTALYGQISAGNVSAMFAGSGITAENNSNILKTVNVGNQFGSTNTFIRNTTSVAVQGNLNLFCTNANFNNCRSFINVRLSPANSTINVENNLGNFSSDFCVFGLDNRANTLIHKNVFRNVQNTGIGWRSVLPNNAQVRIADHPEISGQNMLRGIEAMNFSNLKIENNGGGGSQGILFQASSPSVASGLNRTGIFVENCSNALIKDNNVLRPDNFTGDFTTFPTAEKLKGIMVRNSLNSTICGNNIFRMGMSLNMDANCGSAKINLNKFNKSYHGVYLSSNAIIANLGITSCNPGDNEWNGNINECRIREETPILPNTQKWNFRNDGSNKDLTPIFFTISVAGTFTGQPRPPTSPNAECYTPSVMQMISLEWSEEEFGYIERNDWDFGDSLFQKAQRFTELNYAFNSLISDSTLTTSTDSSDTKFLQFLENFASHPIGQFYQIEKLIEDKDFLQASQLLEAVQDTQIYFSNLKQVYQIYNRILSNDSNEILDDEREFLNDVADLNLNSYGSAVLATRIILNYFPNNFDKQNKLEHFSQNMQNGNLLLFPNPSNRLVFLNTILLPNENGGIEVEDLNGRKVYQKNVCNSNQILYIDLSNLSNGVYFVKVNLSLQGTYTSKVVIHK